VTLGKVVTQREVPSYVTAACSFEFIFLSVQNTNCISKQLTCVTCIDRRWLYILQSTLMYLKVTHRFTGKKYINLICGHYIVLLLEIE